MGNNNASKKKDGKLFPQAVQTTRRVLAKNKLHLPYWQDELDNLEDYPECTIPIAFRLANLASLCPQYEHPPQKN